MKSLIFFALFASAAVAQNIDPAQQINWPRISGSGSPASHSIVCPSATNTPSTATVGRGYTDVSGPHYWQCGNAGWFQVDGAATPGCTTSGGTNQPQGANGTGGCNPITSQVNGTNIATPLLPNFVGAGNVSVSNPSTNEVLITGSAGAPALQMQMLAAPAGQGLFIPFTGCTGTTTNPSLNLQFSCDGKSGVIQTTPGSLFNHNVTDTFVWSVPATIPGLNLATVTNVYVLANNFVAASSPGPTTYSCSGGPMIPASLPPNTQVQYGPLSGITGSNLNTVTCTLSLTQSTLGTFITAGQVQIGLWVQYTGSPVSVPSVLNIAPPLEYLSDGNILTVQPFWPNGDFPLTASELNSAYPASPAQNSGSGFPIYWVSDLSSLSPGAACSGTGTPSLATTGQCISNGTSYIVYQNPTNSLPSGTGVLNVAGGAYQPVMNAGNQIPASWVATIPISQLGNIGANTWLGNGTGSTGPVVANSIPNCNGTNQFLTGIPGTGIGCGTAIGGGGGSLPTATVPGQLIASTAPGTSYAAQPAVRNQTGDTITTIEANCTTLGQSYTYVVDQPQTITLGASHAMNSCVTLQFEDGGKWTVNGAFTLSNIQVSPSSSLTQHFAGTSTLSLSPLVTKIPIEWFGGVGDGNYAANTGTDNTTAATTAIASMTVGELWFQCAQYRFAAAGPTISATGQGIGAPITCPSSKTSVPAHAAILFTSSASATGLTIGGSCPTLTTNNVIENLSFLRGVTPTTGAIGIQAHCTGGLITRNVNIYDSPVGFDWLENFQYGTGSVSANIGFGYTSVTPFVGTNICWNLHGGTTGFGTTNIAIPTCSWNGAPPGGTTLYGYKTDGVVQDLNLYSPQTGFANYGLYMTGTLGQDINITNVTFDNCETECVFDSVSGNTVRIAGGWMAPVDTSSTAGIELNGGSGVTVSDVEFFGNKNIPMINDHAAAGGNTFLGNRFFLSAGQAFSCNGSNAIDFSHNDINGNTATFASPLIQYVNCSYGTLQGNKIYNGIGTAILLDSNSHYNRYVNSNINVTFTLSDADPATNESTQLICSGTITINPGALAANTTSSAITTTCTGLLTTDNIQLDFNADPSAAAGYDASGNDVTIVKYPTSNTINVKVQNRTANPITPASVTANYHVWRN